MSELGEFLRSRRDRLTPADAGLTRAGERRRVPGLRREELAQLAGVSVTYYTRLEQGQSRNASDAVLDALARVLRLSDDEHAHLRVLARPARALRRTNRPQRLRAGTALVLNAVRDMPAFVLGRRTDILAWNRLGHALIAPHLDFDAPSRGGAARPTMARLIVLDTYTRDLYVHWRRKLEDLVSYLRLVSAQHPDDAALTSLIGELCVKSEDFSSVWARHGVRDCGPGIREYRHPLVGELTFTEEIMRLQDDPGQRLVVLATEPGSPTAERLALLASLHATAARACVPSEAASTHPAITPAEHQAG
ncbi:Transcriptional regulator, XRE family [Frankia canadensis]|uniref:Transcriptional regulator, XRE family n=1 Tax=Frankia canadensis TaxID=1836972 RepID=A0A2I2KWD2_9ACTN|nr:helix-turn-helix transcriptional regulator [Frankia canadensis]SNQ49962.1 Transcriptional regulator, XRE family [Frankia canadensis]SOU57252.1 Transcriptional regulator, XRE family [Frankia canadensis]